MQFIELTDPDSGVVYQYSEFSIAGVVFVINFCTDVEIVSTLSVLGEDVADYLRKYTACTVKFMAKEHLESDNLYTPALNHRFKRKEIVALQDQLERLVFEHYLRFTPEGYIFIAERHSLNRMYQRMCATRSDFMRSFQAVYPLGFNQDCFVLITPKGNLK